MLYRDRRVRVNSLQDSIEDLRDEIREVNRKIESLFAEAKAAPTERLRQRQNPPEA
jgi:prefoldin subunit 5